MKNKSKYNSDIDGEKIRKKELLSIINDILNDELICIKKQKVSCGNFVLEDGDYWRLYIFWRSNLTGRYFLGPNIKKTNTDEKKINFKVSNVRTSGRKKSVLGLNILRAVVVHEGIDKDIKKIKKLILKNIKDIKKILKKYDKKIIKISEKKIKKLVKKYNFRRNLVEHIKINFSKNINEDDLKKIEHELTYLPHYDSGISKEFEPTISNKKDLHKTTIKHIQFFILNLKLLNKS